MDTPKDIDLVLLSPQNGIIQILAVAPDGSRAIFNFSLGTLVTLVNLMQLLIADKKNIAGISVSIINGSRRNRT